MILPVILAGGAGSRLWPLSREEYPKQFWPLIDQKTLLQNTLKNIESLSHQYAPLIICNQLHRFIVAEQIRMLASADHATILLEPCSRNTAPAIAVAALLAQKSYGDPLLLVLPADHNISSGEKFCETVQDGIKYAEENHLVVFGISPTHPETGYGYIQSTNLSSHEAGHKVQKFIEKPSLSTAQSYLAAGGYFWNSGIFLFKASTYLEELEKYAPDILIAAKLALSNVTQDMDFLRLDTQSFSNCRNDSIDYAVMEKTDKALMIPFQSAWSDIGSWTALWEVAEKDNAGNVCVGDVFTSETENCYFRSENRLLAAVGMKDCIVTATEDAVLVAHKSAAQQVKQLVETLKQTKRIEVEMHRTVYRPWGSYQLIDESENFKVKRIVVKPNAHLSLQMHRFRSEHWIVVSGKAEVICGDKIFTLHANESTYIPAGVRHRLSNLSEELLQVIEVQSGSYLGEDDIIRFDDYYGRLEAKVDVL